ncbi:hypothetical protein PMIN06_013180 [Paraphaeosphaeria minitans]
MCCGADVATCRVAYESTRTIITAMSTYMTSLGSARLGVCATKQPPPKARKSTQKPTRFQGVRHSTRRGANKSFVRKLGYHSRFHLPFT